MQYLKYVVHAQSCIINSEYSIVGNFHGVQFLRFSRISS
jgi:hypothetical protein